MIDPAGDEMAVEEFLQRVEREKVELVEKIEEEISGLREGAEQRSKMISQTIEELSRRISVVKTKIKTERGVRTSSREDIRVWAENQVLKTRSFLISEVNHLLKQRENTIETVGRGVQKVAPTISEFCVEQVEGMLQTAIGDVAARFLTAKGDFEIKCGKTESAMKQMMDRLTFVQSSTEEKIKSNHIAVEKAIGNHLQSHTDEALRLLEHEERIQEKYCGGQLEAADEEIKLMREGRESADAVVLQKVKLAIQKLNTVSKVVTA